MKKSVLFFTIIVAALFMTSCLGDISNSYSDTSFVYIDSDDVGTVYGKTISLYSPARVITSNDMLMMTPRSFKIMSYSWDEEYGVKPVIVGGQTFQADDVKITSDVIDVRKTSLIMSRIPEIEESKGFLEIAPPMYADTPEFMGDYWIFQYLYEAPKGQTGVVEFYKREDDAEDDIIRIDVSLTFTGTPEGAVSDRKTDYLALDMSQLRQMYQGTSSTETKRLNIKFVYHQAGRESEVESQTYSLTVKK